MALLSHFEALEMFLMLICSPVNCIYGTVKERKQFHRVHIHIHIRTEKKSGAKKKRKMHIFSLFDYPRRKKSYFSFQRPNKKTKKNVKKTKQNSNSLSFSTPLCMKNMQSCRGCREQVQF